MFPVITHLHLLGLIYLKKKILQKQIKTKRKCHKTLRNLRHKLLVQPGQQRWMCRTMLLWSLSQQTRVLLCPVVIVLTFQRRASRLTPTWLDVPAACWLPKSSVVSDTWMCSLDHLVKVFRGKRKRIGSNPSHLCTQETSGCKVRWDSLRVIYQSKLSHCVHSTKRNRHTQDQLIPLQTRYVIWVTGKCIGNSSHSDNYLFNTCY